LNTISLGTVFISEHCGDYMNHLLQCYLFL